MAIFHLSAGIIQRSAGESVVAAAAYRAGERMVETRTGQIHDYRLRRGVDDAVILAPAGAESWVLNRAELWNRADQAEKRRDAQLARSFDLALPRELDSATNRALTVEFLTKHFVGRGMVVDVAFHDLDGANPHAHPLATLRTLDGEGFAARKNREWNRKEFISELREGYATVVNEHLARGNVGQEKWIDHRSLGAQLKAALRRGDYEEAVELCRLPTRHVGKASAAIVARGEESTRAEDLRRDAGAAAWRVTAMLGQVAEWEEEEKTGPERRLNDAWKEAVEKRAIERRVRTEAVESTRRGRELLSAKVRELDPDWWTRDAPRVADSDAALAYAETELARIEAARRAEEEERKSTESGERALAAARRARLRDLQDRFGGREVHVAHLGARVQAGQEPTGEQEEEALTAAESDAERLGRAGRLYEDGWSRLYYAAAAVALGDRFTLETVDATLTEAELFAQRVSDRSKAGRAVVEAVVEECGEHPAVGELGAALERAQEVERQEEERQQAEERRRDQVARRERDVRATREGPRRLSEATERVLGADRPPTVEEREQIAEMVDAWVREDLELLQTELRSTEEGARFLNEAWQKAGAVTTLAEKEQLVDTAKDRLLAYQAAEVRQSASEQELFKLPGGADVYYALLTDLDPGWRDRGKTAVENRERALETASSDSERLGRLRNVLTDPAAAKRCREMLDARGKNINVQDLDAAIEAGLRERAAAEARRQAEEQQRCELDRREAEVRATRAGGKRLKKERSARFGAKRSLTSDERRLVLETVEAQIRQEFDAREAAIKAKAGGGELLRRVEGRRGSPRGLVERMKKIEAVDQVVRATDEVETQLPTTRNPERPSCRVPVVFDAMLRTVLADDAPFVGDVVFLLGARYAQRAREGGAEGGYDAAAREESARRHFGGAVVDAMTWCVLKVREIIVAACRKILGGGGESGKRVQAALEAARVERQAQQSAVESAAQNAGIDVEAFSESAEGDGRDPVSALEEETARRRQLLADAEAFGVDVEAEFEVGGFAAIEAAVKGWQHGVSTARDLRIDVDAVSAAALSRGEDRLAALKKETAWARTVRSYAAAIGFTHERFEWAFMEAQRRHPGSDHTTVWKKLVRTVAREEVRKVLPFEAPALGRPGALVPAIADAWSRALLQMVQDNQSVQDILREVMTESVGSDEERATAEGLYHKRQIQVEHEKQKREHKRWFSSEPTQEKAREAVLARFIPVLAERVRQACAQVQDLDGLMARMVEDDRLRRVQVALEKTLPRETPLGISSPSVAVSDERFSRVAERTSNPSIKVLISTTYLEGLRSGDYFRAQAEAIHLGPRIEEKEESGLGRDQAEAVAREEYEAEVQRHIERVFRQIESRSVEEVLLDRRDVGEVARVDYNVDRTGGDARKQTDRSEGRRQ